MSARAMWSSNHDYSRRGIFGSSILQLYRTTYTHAVGLCDYVGIFSDSYSLFFLLVILFVIFSSVPRIDEACQFSSARSNYRIL